MPYSFEAKEDIAACTIVKFFEGGVKAASAADDDLIGITGSLDVPAGNSADVYMTGERIEVKAGAAFAAGKALTADSAGCAVSAAAGGNIIAIALQAAEAEGDIVQVLVTCQRTIGA